MVAVYAELPCVVDDDPIEAAAEIRPNSPSLQAPLIQKFAPPTLRITAPQKKTNTNPRYVFDLSLDIFERLICTDMTRKRKERLLWNLQTHCIKLNITKSLSRLNYRSLSLDSRLIETFQLFQSLSILLYARTFGRIRKKVYDFQEDISCIPPYWTTNRRKIHVWMRDGHEKTRGIDMLVCLIINVFIIYIQRDMAVF